MDALADLAVDLRRVRQWSPCPACDGAGVVDGRRCDAPQDDPVGDHEWSVCPYGLMTTPQWQAILTVDASAMVSPLEGWPSSWSAGMVDGLLALRGARQRAEAAAAKRAADKARG